MSFPILARQIHGKRLVYLDSAASSQKPASVLSAMREFETGHYSNVHRGVHTLAEEATGRYEKAREQMAEFLSCESCEVVFTSGTTDGLNKAARMMVRECSAGDEIVVSEMEHHSNFVVWQQLALQNGLVLKVIPTTPDYRLDLAAFERLLSSRTRIVAITHASNVLGTINPVREIALCAHKRGALLVVDGAQAAPHLSIDVKALDADVYCLSGHKMYGPTGIGVMYAKKELLERLEPVVYGGEMVNDVAISKTSWNEVPLKFEPGTPNIAGAIGIAAAAKFLASQDLSREKELCEYALEKLKEVEGVAIIGPARDRIGTISFTVEGMHPHDVAAALDLDGIAVRAGHHCCQILHCALGIDATTRASIAVHNTREDIDALVSSLTRARRRIL